MNGLARRRPDRGVAAAVAPAAAVLAVVALALSACTGEEAKKAPAPLVTEEVPAPIDAAVTTQYDVQARSSEEIVGASLPPGFPADLPLCSSTVVNHGPAGPGRLFVTLSTPATPDSAARRCDRQLEAGGWSRVADGEFERRGRRIAVRYRPGAPGTWIRIEYPVGG